MRVLFLSNFFFPSIGGVEARALPFIQAMRGRSLKIIIVTNRDPAGEYPVESNYEGPRATACARIRLWAVDNGPLGN